MWIKWTRCWGVLLQFLVHSVLGGLCQCIKTQGSSSILVAYVDDFQNKWGMWWESGFQDSFIIYSSVFDNEQVDFIKNLRLSSSFKYATKKHLGASPFLFNINGLPVPRFLRLTAIDGRETAALLRSSVAVAEGRCGTSRSRSQRSPWFHREKNME